MSALGQKQTFAVQDAVSALPPKATSNATYGMSTRGQKRHREDASFELVAFSGREGIKIAHPSHLPNLFYGLLPGVRIVRYVADTS